jgi:CheY-like chemotaxis protein
MAHKLLLADDSVTIQRVIELTFADEDVQVVVVSNGRQAIERVRAERFDIVLADIGMPERDGYEVAAFIKNDPQLAQMPVLLLTGAFEPLDENRARAVGCDGVLVKPFEPQMVINRVKELLSGHRPTARPQPAAWQAPGSQPSAPQAAARASGAIEPPPPALFEKSGGALEDYFDRLDAAFSNVGAPLSAQPPKLEQRRLEQEDLSAGVNELPRPLPEAVPAAIENEMSRWDPDLGGDVVPAGQPEPQGHLADAFAALLAAEEGHRAPYSPPAVLSEETIEEIVRRVIARLSDESMRRVVVDTAERLVREEIDRIKRAANS